MGVVVRGPAGAGCVLLAALYLSGCAALDPSRRPGDASSAPAAANLPEEAPVEPALAKEAAAADTAAPPAMSCERPDAVEVPVVDRTKRLLEETTCSAALWLDGMFGGDDVEAARKTHGRLLIGGRWSEFDGFDDRIRMSLRVKLPAMKERLSAFVGRDDEDEVARDQQRQYAVRTQFPQVQERESWLAGFGYSFPGSDRWQSDFRIGVRGLRLRTFVYNRFGYNAYADDENLLHFRATPFWNSRDGFGFTLGSDYAHVLSPSRLLRWDNVATISEETVGVDWRSALIHYQNLRRNRGLAYQAYIEGQTDEPEPLRQYGVRTTYRQPIMWGRMFAETTLGYGWPRYDPAAKREGSAEVGINFELPFGGD